MDLFGGGAEGDDRPAVVRARLGLMALALGMAACLAVALQKNPNPPLVPPPGATSDLDLYRKIVDRVSAGESYYDAAQQELRSHGYPTRSVFNWRTPVYAWLLGRGPGLDWCRWLLMVGVVAAVVMSCHDLPDDFGIVPAAVGGTFLVGATAWCFGGETFLFMELWSGMLIAFSVGAYRRGWTAVGFATGLMAVFYRELALPYAVVSLGLAVWHGRKREAAAWVFGLLLFAAFLGYHAHQVHTRLTDVDQAMADGWVKFGGIRFLLDTAQTNVFLMAAPLWCTALYLPLAALGLTAGRGEPGWRVGLTGALFLVAFSVVGNPFNFYWGFLNAPLLAIGLAGAPSALCRLITTGFRFRHSMAHGLVGGVVRV